jgi:hypothetical protein
MFFKSQNKNNIFLIIFFELKEEKIFFMLYQKLTKKNVFLYIVQEYSVMTSWLSFLIKRTFLRPEVKTLR